MEAKLLDHHQIDKTLWDACVSASQRPDIYAFSWFLDIECPCWKAIVYGDYEAVFPLPHRKRYRFIDALIIGYLTKDYIIYSQRPDIQLDHSLVVKILKSYRFITISLSGVDLGHFPTKYITEKKRQILDFETPHKYPSKRLRESLKIAEKASFVMSYDIDRTETVSFIKGHLFQRENLDAEILYKSLDHLIEYAIQNNIGRCAGIYKDHKLSAVIFYMVFNQRLYFVQNAIDDQSKRLAGMHWMFYNIIEKHRHEIKSVDFFGSNNEKIRLFIRNFSNEEINYQFVQKKFF